MKHKLLTALAACLALIGGFYAGMHQFPTSPWPPTALQLQTPQGQVLDWNLFKNKRVVINFWATWCPPCLEEMPELNQLYKELSEVKNSNIEFIGLAIDKPEQVHAFLQQHPVNYPLAIMGFEGSELAKQLGNDQGGLPFTVILDKNGHVLLKKAGRIHMDEIKHALRE